MIRSEMDTKSWGECEHASSVSNFLIVGWKKKKKMFVVKCLSGAISRLRIFVDNSTSLE